MRTVTRLLLAACCSLLAGGCATPLPPPPPTADLFTDASFSAPATPLGAEQLFALSPAMRAKLDSEAFREHLRRAGPEQGLFEALYNPGELQLFYDDTITRNAADTYAAGKGNCMSLVIMTAAFAKALGLEVRFQAVAVDEQWSRSGDIYVASTHVNLGLPVKDRITGARTGTKLTIDFMPSTDASRYQTDPLDEQTITSMFMNNRAAEELAGKHLDQAYWWARAAIEKNPALVIAYNTLGVIYQRHGDLAMAEKVYQRALTREPEDTIVMRNLVSVLASQGKLEQAKTLTDRLARIDPTPPFYYFQRGMRAMEEGRYIDARSLFKREVTRSPYYHEFHFWLAIAHLRLGEPRAADDEMARAIDTSTSDGATKLYSAKLAYLRAQDQQARKHVN